MKNKIAEYIAFNLLPVRLVYFCYIRFMADATTFEEGRKMTPDEMTFSKATELYERKHFKI